LKLRLRGRADADGCRLSAGFTGSRRGASGPICL